jgi:hypothetical protein
VAPRPLSRLRRRVRPRRVAGVLPVAGGAGAAAACDSHPVGAAMEGSLARADGLRHRRRVVRGSDHPLRSWRPRRRVEAGTLAAQLATFPIDHGPHHLARDRGFRGSRPPPRRSETVTGGPRSSSVQSHRDLGARLAVYGLTPEARPPSRSPPRRISASATAGSPRLARPISTAMAAMEIAYVDRPHLARTCASGAHAAPDAAP